MLDAVAGKIVYVPKGRASLIVSQESVDLQKDPHLERLDEVPAFPTNNQRLTNNFPLQKGNLGLQKGDHSRLHGITCNKKSCIYVTQPNELDKEKEKDKAMMGSPPMASEKEKVSEDKQLGKREK